MASPLARLLLPQQAQNTIDLEPSREKFEHTARAGRRRPLSVFGTLQSRSLCGSELSRRPRPLRASHDHLVGSLSLWTKLRAHSGCVNTISWCADDPSLLASGSDDTRVLVWRVPPRISADDPLRPASTTDTGHTHNIFGVVFVPRTPGEVVTCAADGEVRHHDLEAQRSKLLLPTPGGGWAGVLTPLCGLRGERVAARDLRCDARQAIIGQLAAAVGGGGEAQPGVEGVN